MEQHREWADLKRSVFEFEQDEVRDALVRALGDKLPEKDYEGTWSLELVHPVMRDNQGYLARLSWTKHSGFRHNVTD